MRPLIMTRLLRAEALSDARAGSLQIETNEGPVELRFTFEDAERLIAGLQIAKDKIQRERARTAQPPIAEKPKIGERWETALDPVNQVVVLRAHLPDHTTQDTRIPRTEIAGIAKFLGEALKRFEAGAEMRQ